MRLLRYCRAMRERLELHELSGAFGDVGTFLPLTVGLVSQIGLDLGTTLIFTGLYNILSGLLFDIPMGVQPMKTIASVALTEGLTLPEMAAAGMFVSTTVLLLGVTRLIELVSWMIPSSLVRGIQLAVGSKLAINGMQMALKQRVEGELVWRGMAGTGSIWLGIAGLALCAATLIPVAEQRSAGVMDGSTDGMLRHASCAAPAAELERQLSGRLMPIPSGPVFNASTSIARDLVADVSYQNLMIITGQLDYIEEGSHGPDAADSNSQQGAGACSKGSRALLHDAGPIPSDEATMDGDSASRQIRGAAGAAGQDASSSSTQPLQLAPGAICCSTSGSSAQPRAPTALIILALGILLTVGLDNSSISGLSFGPQLPSFIVPSRQQLDSGITKAGIAQLPLTTLNSVIAVTALARELYPNRDTGRWSPATVSISVGLMNLVGCWFGAMPCCHGAGGLAAQHRFGARWGTAPVLLGSIKLLLGLLFGSSLFTLLRAFPQPLLGAMLAFSGIELASSAAKESSQRGWVLMLFTAAAILALGNTGIGFAAGYLALLVLLAWERLAAVMRSCHAAGAAGISTTGAAGLTHPDEQKHLMAKALDRSSVN